MKHTILFIVFTIFFLTGCKKEETVCEPEANGAEIEMAIVQFNTTNAATGFETVFTGLESDSMKMAQIAQAFVNPVRFLKDRSGYFFVENWNGWMLAHPINAEWIGTNRFNIQDPTGKYYVRDMINTSKYSGYGIVEYVIKDPVDGVNRTKTGFVNAIPSMPGFVGSGLYLTGNQQYYAPLDAKKYMVEELTRSMAEGLGGVLTGFCQDTLERVDFCRRMIDHVHFFDDGSGYFFIYNLNCVNVAHGYQKELEGQDLYNLQDSHGTYIIRDFATLVKAQGSGFYQYWWPDPATNTDEPKLAYLTTIPGTGYFIGAGFYLVQQ